jgi:hypothetical protein
MGSRFFAFEYRVVLDIMKALTAVGPCIPLHAPCVGLVISKFIVD